MKKLGKSSKKGFTLVELIVVLVILAVLAAMLVPALVGYIDRAKKEKEFQAASTVYTAVQSLATEAYGKDKATVADYDKFTKEEVGKLTGITDIAEIKYDVKAGTETINKFTIEKISVKFKTTDEYYYIYTAGATTWDTSKTANATTAMT